MHKIIKIQVICFNSCSCENIMGEYDHSDFDCDMVVSAKNRHLRHLRLEETPVLGFPLLGIFAFFAILFCSPPKNG